MYKNQETDFSKITHISCPRSKFHRLSEHITSGNKGALIPFYNDIDILPGDTHIFTTAVVARTTNPTVKPFFGNLWLDIWYFFVPYRQIWDHTKEFFGENEDSAWFSSTEYTIPQMQHPTTGVVKGTVANYMSSPIGAKTGTISAIGIRAYNRIYKYFFRDENLIAPKEQYTDDTTRVMDMNDPNLGGKVYNVAKLHDYFTSCLPGPQKGPEVTIPLGETAPVRGNGYALGISNGTQEGSFNVGNISGVHGVYAYTENLPKNTGERPGGSVFDYDKSIGITENGANSGMVADLSEAISASINTLRLGFATQRILERDARGGTRFDEIISSQFGVTVASLEIQTPEYLGGCRLPLNISQITQNSSGTDNSRLGDLAGQSLTFDTRKNFAKSFKEWGCIIGLCAVRQSHIYQQGIERSYFRKRRFDFYFPEFAFLGEQPVYNREIYYDGENEENSTNEEVFGFQERWAEYRYKPSRISGEMSSMYAQPLDVWHLADYYESLPMLGQDWIEETPDELDRCLSVSSKIADQFMFDFAVLDTAIRPMPVRSTPGLIDHY